MLVSIIIPCYNNSKTIIETLNSALSQTHKLLEIIVIDDGSMDDSSEVIKQFIAPYNNIRLLSKNNEGVSKARNYAAGYADGDFLVFLDGDDKLHPAYVEKCLSEYQKNPDLNIVYSSAEYFGLKNEVWELPPYDIKTFLIDNCIPIYAMIKRKVFLEVGRFDENLNYMEDWELWLRIIKNYDGIYKIPEILFYYRKSENHDSLTDQNSQNANNTFDKSLLYIYNKHYSLYKEHQLSLRELLLMTYNNEKYKKKYYDVWYRKLIYKFFNQRKYKLIYEK